MIVLEVLFRVMVAVWVLTLALLSMLTLTVASFLKPLQRRVVLRERGLRRRHLNKRRSSRTKAGATTLYARLRVTESLKSLLEKTQRGLWRFHAKTTPKVPPRSGRSSARGRRHRITRSTLVRTVLYSTKVIWNTCRKSLKRWVSPSAWRKKSPRRTTIISQSEPPKVKKHISSKSKRTGKPSKKSGE